MPVLLQKRARLTKPKSVGYSGGGNVYSEDQLAGFWGAKFPASQTSSGVNVTVDNSLTFAAVYAARRVISTTLGVLPVDVIRKSVKGDRQVRTPEPLHRVAVCLGREPNLEQTPMVFKEHIGMELTGWGNSYHEIEFAGPRVYLHPLCTERVTVSRDKTNRLEYLYAQEEGGTVRLAQSQVLHIPLLGNGVVGKSPIQCARESIGMGMAAERFGAAYFGNGLNPGGLLIHPGKLDPKGRENLRSAFESRHRGSSKAGKMMILEEGMKWEQVGIPAKDAQFLETRQFQVLDVARWFGVPPHMLGDPSQAKWANITQYALEFVKYTMMHYLVRIEQEINRKLLRTEPDVEVKFNVAGLLRGDLVEQMASLIQGLGNGIYALNDVMEKLDMNPVEGEIGETRWLTQQYVPIERALNPPEAEAPEDDPDDPESEEEPTEGTSDEESERSLTVVGDPKTFTGADDAMRVVFRDAAGRLVSEERKAMRTLLKKSDTDERLLKAVGEFMDRYQPEVVSAFGPAWRARGMLLGCAIDVQRAASQYVSDVRELMLDAARNHTMPTLVEVWANGRADQVVTQYMELN